MRGTPISLLSLCLFVSPLAAQTAASSAGPVAKPSSTQGVQPSGITLATSTQLVVIDVVVQDRDGHPVHGLKASDFLLNEGKNPQTIKSFDEHATTDLSHAKIEKLPPMPPGTFTDYTPVPEDGTLNILLLDALNTPMADQSYVRYQLQQYVKHATPGTRIAIFGLSSRLFLLQGFSSDPEVLKAAVDHKLIPRASHLLDDPVGASTDSKKLSDDMANLTGGGSTLDSALLQVVANLKQFEAESSTFQTQLRIRYTLDAFNQLGRYLSTFNGRKNLLWFSGSFPLAIFADPTLNDPFAVQTDSSVEVHQTTSLLARSRVAVYPIDARGIQTLPMFSASRSGAEYGRNPAKLSQDLSNFSTSNAEEHMTMDTIADETGGRAFYNTNGLAEAVSKSIDSGANYYTLTYAPTDHRWNGAFRSIHLKLEGAHATEQLKLSYRNGYYADDASDRMKNTSSSLIASDRVAAPATGSDAFARAAMMRGAPTPSEILFKVRVLPDIATTSQTIAAHNQPNPKLKQPGPFRLYNIDFAAAMSNLKLKRTVDGKYTGAVEFVTYVYDADGVLLNADGSTVNMDMLPETYAQTRHAGVNFRQQVSAPAKGESFLRIAVHDLSSGRYGVVEVPTSAVSQLAPAPAPSTPAASSRGPATAAPPVSLPSNSHL